MSEPIPHLEGRTIGYRHCRCDACYRYRYRYRKRLKAALRHGPVLVDAAPVWAHIDGLVAQGFSTPLIARVAGIDNGAIRNRPARTRVATADALLGVTPELLYRAARGHERVPAVGAVRRLQALAYLGWSIPAIVAGAAYHTPNAEPVVGRVRSRGLRQRSTTANAYRLIGAAYDALAMTTGPSDLVRNDAQRRGWAPPLCWDDDTIDNPSARPHGYRTAAEAKASRHAEFTEAVSDLTRRGYTAAEIADRLHCAQRSVTRIRAELAAAAEQNAAAANLEESA